MRTLSLLIARLAGFACAVALLAVPAAPAAADTNTERARIDRVVRQTMQREGFQSVLVQVTRAGRPVLTRAYGNSMTGVPATTRMHFRNGAVAIWYMSTLLLRLVDQGKVSLDDPLAKWLPNIRNADRVTLRMLAQMTAGYHDYELDPRLTNQLSANPFATISTRRQLDLMLSRPQQFTPGTNWSYAHSDYVLLGLALERITGRPLDVALERQVLRPMGLRSTRASITARIPEPALHTYSAERRAFLRIPRGVPFIEESTYWNPSWTLAHGAIQTTTLADMTRTAIAVGTGRLLSRRSYQEMIDPHIGFGRPQAGCERCRTMTRFYGYGLGSVRNGSWILQNPLFAGLGSVAAYLPSKRISVVVVSALGERSFDAQGNPTNAWLTLYSRIGAIMAPDDRPPVPPSQ